MRQDWPLALFSAVLIAVSAGLFWNALGIPVGPYDPVLGARLFPLAVTGGLTVLGILLLFSAVVSPTEPEMPEPPVRWIPIGFILAGLLVFSLLVDPAGFVIAAAALFVLVARAFRSARLLKDAVIGLVLAAAIFVVFNYGLGLHLPAGRLAGLLHLGS